MKFKHSIVLLSACMLQLSCATQKVTNKLDSLSASELRPFGRTVFDERKGLELIGSAVHFGFTFEGDACDIYASIPDVKGHNYLQYELDGVYQKRILITGKDSAAIHITVPTGKHEIKVFKATEAHTGPIFIAKVTAKNIKPLAIKQAPIIEFIGNSITCGAAADVSEVACGAGEYHDQHNAYMAYGPRIARMLDVNYFLSSVSGIGIYRNWNSEGPNMPEVYEKVDFQIQRTQKWDFSTYSPAVVSIALGTNDFSNGDGKSPRKPFDAATFTNNYIKFVQLVKSKYPDAQIALLSSPMVKGESRIKLQECLTAVQQKIDELYPADKKVATFFFEPMEARGCTGHPSVEDHAILANQLKDFFAGLLKS
jgi:hypothetical protein